MIKLEDFICTDESGKSVIKNTSFFIGENERIAILSSNQEQATILCHAIAGILSRTHPAHSIDGKVYLNDRLISDIESHDLTEIIAYVPPNSDLLISGVKDTVFGEIALSLELTGTEPEVIREKVSGILKKLSIEKLANRDPDELSGGERHKVALASMIVREPDFLILDNPTMFLDHTGVHNLLSIIQKYHGAIILADPNPYIWASVADRFVVISESAVKAIESSGDLIQRINSGNLQIDLPAWTELYMNLKDRLPVSTVNDVFRSLGVIRAISGAIR